MLTFAPIYIFTLVVFGGKVWGQVGNNGGKMSLSDINCKNAKPCINPNKPHEDFSGKAYKLFDGGGLYLEVLPTGSKLWRIKYRYLGKERRLSLGAYPVVSLADAREQRMEIKKLLAKDIDPAQARREVRQGLIRNAENTFKAVALEWHEKQVGGWSDNHANNVLRRLKRDVFPYIGNRPIANIDAPELLDVLRKIEKRGALDIAARARQVCGQIFRYGMQTSRCKHDPSVALKGALQSKKTKHFAALEPKEIPELLRALERNDARLFARTRRAIQFSMLMFLRPSEIIMARWEEIDWDAKEWIIPAERMKGREKHIVPLSDQAIQVLKDQHEETSMLNTPWIFPSTVRPLNHMNKETVAKALWALGFKGRMTAHGFRAMARTAIREKLEYDPDIIEAQLAHKPTGANGAAYDRCRHMDKRRAMLQEWADYLDAASRQGQVIRANFGK